MGLVVLYTSSTVMYPSEQYMFLTNTYTLHTTVYIYPLVQLLQHFHSDLMPQYSLYFSISHFYTPLTGTLTHWPFLFSFVSFCPLLEMTDSSNLICISVPA